MLLIKKTFFYLFPIKQTSNHSEVHIKLAKKLCFITRPMLDGIRANVNTGIHYSDILFRLIITVGDVLIDQRSCGRSLL